MTLRIDAHHHLWQYNAKEYDWIGDDMLSLRRDFLLPELEHAISSARVDGTIVVQARQTVDETRWLLSLAEASPKILGVVGWLPLGEPKFANLLEEFHVNPWLKGLRHVVQSESEGFLEWPGFNAGIAQLAGTSLVYDLLITERQVAEAISFVDTHPRQSFVLDHLAKPRIRQGELQPWGSLIRELARRPNVTAKISGLITETDVNRWTVDQLRPYLDTALEAFGPQRLMIGTDWPVLTLGATYRRWWQILEHWAAGWSESDVAALLGVTAERVYELTVPNTESTTTSTNDGEINS